MSPATSRFPEARASNTSNVLDTAAGLAKEFLDGLGRRPVRATASIADLRERLGQPLTEEGLAPETVVAEMARAVEPGLVASAGPRFFGFVIGGSHPAAVAADWLTSAWDQNAGLSATSPAAAVVEEVAAAWLLELLGLPPSASVGFVTGGQMANFVGLAAGRHAVLERVGWNVEEEGLQHGAPPVQVVVGEEVHVTILSALRMLGLGSRRAQRVAVDAQGRMRPDDLARVLRECSGPTLVCAQAGNVNTGAFDPLNEIVPLVRERGAWLHVDGAFGLWAGASPALRQYLVGVDRADSWATDAHKWLNVPYDCGIAVVAEPAAHRAALTARASYLVQTTGAERDPFEWVPEFSRRARGFPVYAALRSLGRRGVAEMIERCCRLARRMAEGLGRGPGIRILNEVVLNQVLVRFEPPAGGDADAFTRAVIARVQRDGTAWLGGSRWRDQEVMRISVSNWSTTEADADASVEAILAAAAAEASAPAAASEAGATGSSRERK
jgi:glutamate/tyrosine decarboxylase-like PLP-dependent enzyme